MLIKQVLCLDDLLVKNIRIWYDIIAYTEKENVPGMILLIDFEKAFDTVSHHFLYKTLSFL